VWNTWLVNLNSGLRLQLSSLVSAKDWSKKWTDPLYLNSGLSNQHIGPTATLQWVGVTARCDQGLISQWSSGGCFDWNSQNPRPAGPRVGWCSWGGGSKSPSHPLGGWGSVVSSPLGSSQSFLDILLLRKHVFFNKWSHTPELFGHQCGGRP